MTRIRTRHARRIWMYASLGLLVVAGLALGVAHFDQALASALTPGGGWVTYRNPVYGYALTYAASWHVWRSDPRLAQYFSNYDERAIGDDFPVTGGAAKIQVEPFLKRAGQSLSAWLAVMDRDLAGGGAARLAAKTHLHVAGLPAVLLRLGPQATTEYVDAGAVVFKVSVHQSLDADAALSQRILASFHLAGALHLNQAAVLPTTLTPSLTSGTPAPPANPPFQSHRLNLPLTIDYAWYDSGNGGWMSNLAVTGGGVNSWLDHNQPNHTCDGTLTRYDGQILASGCGTNCTLSVSCYDGHPGIDFSTDAQTGIPVYAADRGTVTTFSDSVCGTAIDIASSTYAGITTRYCHLSGYVSGIANGVTVAQGQQIALSGCTGNCAGPHLHFQVNNTDNASGQPQAIDPFGWSGSGSDPWPYDLGYLWSTSPPSFVGHNLHTVTPTLSSGWTAYTDHYGVAAWYAPTITGNTATATATWSAPSGPASSPLACAGVEVWVPTDHGSATSASYTLTFGDGTPSQTASVNQNANTSWYTIYRGSHPVATVSLGNNTGANNQQVAAAQVWFSC